MADEEVLFDDVYELCEIIGKWVHKAHFSYFFDVYYPLHSRWILNISSSDIHTYCVNIMYAMQWLDVIIIRVNNGSTFLCTTGHKICINCIALQEVLWDV